MEIAIAGPISISSRAIKQECYQADPAMEIAITLRVDLLAEVYPVMRVGRQALPLKLDRAAVALEDLASKGPLKSEGLRGLAEKTYDDYLQNDDITVRDGLKAMPPVVGERKMEDKDHFRTGWLLSEEMTKKMLDQSMAMK